MANLSSDPGVVRASTEEIRHQWRELGQSPTRFQVTYRETVGLLRALFARVARRNNDGRGLAPRYCSATSPLLPTRARDA